MEEKVIEIDLKALVNIFRKRWAWIATSTIAGFLILLMVSLFMLPRKYTSSVSLYVNNLTSVSLTGDVNINDINASQKLVDTYIVILQDDDVLLAPAPFDALYPHYLCAMTDAALGETDRYVGEQAQYNSLLADLAAWLRRSYPTLTGAQWRW